MPAELFKRHSIRISDKTVAKLLREHGFSLQAPTKSVEGAQHPDLDAQFEYSNAKAQDHVGCNIPVISVDTKKKELVGNFKNGGREWQPKDEPKLVDVHDFAGDAVGSNSYRSHVWKHQLPRIADKLGLIMHVSHFPPGTSNWNKVEHRLFELT